MSMSKKTLNKINLEALGAERLAALLIEVSTGSAIIKRRLRLELVHSLGASELAHEVRKRLVSLGKSNSRIGWRRRKALITDLSTQVAMITEKIAPEDPTTAFDLLWQFIEIAPSIYGRVDDSRGDVGDVFRAALVHFEDITPRAFLDEDALAERVWAAVLDNGYGEWDGIIPLMAPTLAEEGLAKLMAHAEAYAAGPLEVGEEDHEAIQFLRQLRGENSYAAERKASFVKWCLQEIAAAAGDTGAYIAQYSAEDLSRQDIAAEVALLMLADNDARGALDLLLGVDQDGRNNGREAWDNAYIACLIALERQGEAQAHRWVCFSSTLNTQHLRDYLKILPDFEDVEAEGRAKKHVLEFPDVSIALEFCLNWPDLLTAAQLITTRADEFNGNHYSLLTPAAEALRIRHPLAAVLLWRVMIDYALGQGRASRYAHAADHLMDCALLDAEITDYGTNFNHERYFQVLQTRHDRKSSFWTKVH
jgi:Family of unknown function (DUF6880)